MVVCCAEIVDYLLPPTPPLSEGSEGSTSGSGLTLLLCPWGIKIASLAPWLGWEVTGG